MDSRRISEKYTEIADRLIDEEPELGYIKDSEVTIIYLSSEHEKKQKGKVVFGQCERVPEKYKWAVPCDFMITVFEPNVERFTKKQLEILIHHELLHVGIELDGNEERYFVVPHDIEDFRTIIERYGVDWNE